MATEGHFADREGEQPTHLKCWRKFSVGDSTDECLVVMSADTSLDHAVGEQALPTKESELNEALTNASLIFVVSERPGFEPLTWLSKRSKTYCSQAAVVCLRTDWKEAERVVEGLAAAINQTDSDNPFYIDLCDAFHIHNGAHLQVAGAEIGLTEESCFILAAQSTVDEVIVKANPLNLPLKHVFVIFRMNFRKSSAQLGKLLKHVHSRLGVHEGLSLAYAKSERNMLEHNEFFVLLAPI